MERSSSTESHRSRWESNEVQVKPRCAAVCLDPSWTARGLWKGEWGGEGCEELWTTAPMRPRGSLHCHERHWEPSPECNFTVFFFQLTQFITFYSLKGIVICTFYLIQDENSWWNRPSEGKSSVFLQSPILMLLNDTVPHLFIFWGLLPHLVQKSSSEWNKIVLWMAAIHWKMELRTICRNQHYLWSPVETHIMGF